MNQTNHANKFFLPMTEDISEQISILDFQEAGELLKAVLLYVQTGEIPPLSKPAALVFISLRRELDKKAARRTKKIETLCEPHGKENDTNEYQSKRSHTNVSGRIQTDANYADKDKEKDIDKDIDKDKEKDEDKEKEKEKDIVFDKEKEHSSDETAESALKDIQADENKNSPPADIMTGESLLEKTKCLLLLLNLISASGYRLSRKIAVDLHNKKHPQRDR